MGVNNCKKVQIARGLEVEGINSEYIEDGNDI